MKTAKFQYKCRRCSSINESLATTEERASMYLIAAIDNVDLPHEAMQPRMNSIHHCRDDGVGITDLIGYQVYETE